MPGHLVQVTLAAGSGPPSNNLRPMTGHPPNPPQPRGCRTHPPAPAPAPASQPQSPARPPQSLPYSSPGGRGASLIASPPETYRRFERPPANSYQPQPSRKAKAKKKKKKTMTKRAGLFGVVCLLVGSIKYSWKVNVPHTGEVWCWQTSGGSETVSAQLPG